MAGTLNDKTRELLDGKNFATVATLNPDGSPHTSVVWIARDGDAVVFSITMDRQKARNLARDPRVGITVFDLTNPYVAVDIRGRAELIDDPDRSMPNRLSHKYLGRDWPVEPEHVRRVTVRVTPDRVIGPRG